MAQLLIDENIVISADSTHNEAKMKLAEIYEILGEPRKALDLVMQGKDPTPLFSSRRPQLWTLPAPSYRFQKKETGSTARQRW